MFEPKGLTWTYSNSSKLNIAVVKDLNWQKTGQVAITQRSRGVHLETPEKRLPTTDC